MFPLQTNWPIRKTAVTEPLFFSLFPSACNHCNTPAIRAVCVSCLCDEVYRIWLHGGTLLLLLPAPPRPRYAVSLPPLSGKQQGERIPSLSSLPSFIGSDRGRGGGRAESAGTPKNKNKQQKKKQKIQNAPQNHLQNN